MQAFESLINEGLPIKLVLVSSLRLEPYAAAETEADLIWAKEKIAQNPDWIEYYEQLPHKDVYKLIDSSDVACCQAGRIATGFRCWSARRMAVR